MLLTLRAARKRRHAERDEYESAEVILRPILIGQPASTAARGGPAPYPSARKAPSVRRGPVNAANGVDEGATVKSLACKDLRRSAGTLEMWCRETGCGSRSGAWQAACILLSPNRKRSFRISMFGQMCGKRA